MKALGHRGQAVASGCGRDLGFRQENFDQSVACMLALLHAPLYFHRQRVKPGVWPYKRSTKTD